MLKIAIPVTIQSKDAFEVFYSHLSSIWDKSPTQQSIVSQLKQIEIH